MESTTLWQRLRDVGKTLDGDYVVAVELRDGRRFSEVYVKEAKGGLLGTITAVEGDNYTRLEPEAIGDMYSSPHRVPDEIAMEAWMRGESGMGYFRLNVLLRDGRKLQDVIAGRPYVIRLEAPYEAKDIVRIEHAGFH